MDASDSLEERIARYRQMKAMKDEGKTLSEISEATKVSRQRVHGILKAGEPKSVGRPKKETLPE